MTCSTEWTAALSMAAFQDNVRLRLSGTIDLEGYHFQQPAPGLIDSNIDNLFNPRLTLFLDAQIGSQVYAFVQSRLDRGFDPSDHGAQVRPRLNTPSDSPHGRTDDSLFRSVSSPP